MSEFLGDFYTIFNQSHLKSQISKKMFTLLKIVVIPILAVCILLSFMNVILVGKEMTRIGVVSRIFTMIYMISYLISMCVWISRATLAGHQDDVPYICLVFPTFFFNIALGGICLQSLIKFDKVLPRAVNATHLWKMKFLYSMHAIVCLVTLAFPFAAYALQVDPKLFPNILTAFNVWVVILEISISYQFLRTLLARRQCLSNSIKEDQVKIKYLNAMVFYIKLSYVLIVAFLVLYVGSGSLITAKIISQDLADSVAAVVVNFYFTGYIRQKNIISKIYL